MVLQFRTATLGVAGELRFWKHTTFTCFWRFVRTRIHSYFPSSIGQFFPDSEVAAGDEDGITISVLGVAFVVPPGETHVVGWAHLCSLRGPGELVVFGVPLGLGGDTGAAEDGGLAIVEGDGIVGEPGTEGFATACGDVFGEATFELHEEEDTGSESGLSEGTCCG